MKKTLTEQETKALVEKVKQMNPDDLLAIVNATIKKEEAKKARREAKKAKDVLDSMRRGGV